MGKIGGSSGLIRAKGRFGYAIGAIIRAGGLRLPFAGNGLAQSVGVGAESGVHRAVTILDADGQPVGLVEIEAYLDGVAVDGRDAVGDRAEAFE